MSDRFIVNRDVPLEKCDSCGYLCGGVTLCGECRQFVCDGCWASTLAMCRKCAEAWLAEVGGDEP